MDPSTEVEILRACCCVAGADGQCGEPENQIINKLARAIGVGRASLDAMIERAETDQDFYKKHFEILKAEPTQALATLFQVALADGVLVEQEVSMLQHLAGNLGVPSEIFEEVKLAASKTLQ